MRPRIHRTFFKPEFAPRVKASGQSFDALAAYAGYLHSENLYADLAEPYVRASPLTIQRLQRVADAVGIRHSDIFEHTPEDDL